MRGVSAQARAVIAVGRRDGVVVAALAVGVTAGLALVGLRAWNDGLEPEGRNWWLIAGLTVGAADLAIGAHLARYRRALGAAVVVSGAGLLAGAVASQYGAAAAGRVDGLPAAGLIASAQAPATLIGVTALCVAVPLRLPAGAGRRRFGPALLAVGAVALTAALVDAFTKPPPWTPAAPASPLMVTGRSRDVLEVAGRSGRVVIVVVAAAAITAVVAAWWRPGAPRDPLTGWLAVGALIAGAAATPTILVAVDDALPGSAIVVPLLLVATLPLFSIAVLVSATHTSPWQAGTASHRFIEWLVLASTITLTYTVAVAGLGRLMGGSGPTWLLVAVTGAVVLSLEPVRGRIRTFVDHVLYGERGDPLALTREVMEHVGSVGDVDRLLPTLATTVGTALRLDYVRIDVAGPSGWARSGVHGDARLRRRSFPLTHQGDEVGRLVVGWADGSSLRRRDSAVLADLLAHLAHVVSWVKLTLDLRRSNLAVTAAREEERRRLRRDLHDGLGPSLTGISLGLRTGLRQVDRGDAGGRAQALSLMASLADEVDRTVAEVKRIVRDLRPTALDERDLPSALVDLARRLEPAVHVHLRLPAELPGLPAAVEVATYRITSEALTNVVRHASASQCWVRLDVDGAVAIEVVDDGIGLPASVRPGVGLTAMRERVTELGGSMVFSPALPHGTRLQVTLPAALP